MGQLHFNGLLVMLVLAITAASAQSNSSSGQCDPTGPRVFCGWNGVPEDQCTGQYGCCYSAASSTVGNSGAELALPACFKYNTGGSTYSLAGPANGGGSLASVSGTQSELGSDLTGLSLTVTNVNPSILRVTIGKSGRYTIPQNTLFQNVDIQKGSGANLYTYTSVSSPFSFKVNRAGNASAPPVFDTTGQRLMFKDQYLEITTAIQPTSRFFGLGERIPSSGMELLKNGVPLALWTRDQPAADPDQNNYGAHPNFLEIRPDGTANGLIMMNSNGMDVTLTNDTMRFSITGGVLDMYFLMGPSPFDVNDQLTQVVGRPVMPPYWSMGFMNSKYGYQSSDYYTYVLDQYAQANIPLETFVADSQYMNMSQIWTLGSNFSVPDMKAIIDGIHARGQRFVPIVEPVVHIQPGYSVYDTGKAEGVFVNDVTGNPYVGQLWPGAVNWPDFMNPKTVSWWLDQMTAFHQVMEFDGLWLDMNEVSNYCTGDVCEVPGGVGEQNQFICQLTCQSGPTTATNGSSNTGNATVPPASYFTPPFAINNGNSQLPISTKTLAVTASHFDGTLEYNVHNLYGLYMAQATYQGLVKLRQKRPFILTRSTFLGSGAYAAHWTGDTMSAWEDMQWSIPSVLNQGLSGIPFAGADICGFENYATESLCARWTAIGAWYPFCRDHHADGFQELYRWPTVAQIARQQLGWRMRAMPYLYTAFFDAHHYGCPVARPMFYAFPADGGSFEASSTQWLMGDGLMIAPVTVENSTNVAAYFPAAKWYSLYDYSVVDASAGSLVKNYEVGLTDNAPIYIMGGLVMPLGEGGMVTDAARNSSLTLVVAFPSTNGTNPPSAVLCGTGCPAATETNSVVACGHMYLDGGEELQVGGARDNYLSFFAETSRGTSGAGSLQVTFAGNPIGNSTACSAGTVWPDVQTIDVLGLTAVDTSTVTLTSLTATDPTSAATGASLPLAAGSVEFHNGVLSVANLDQGLDCPTGFRLSWGTATAATGVTSTAG